MNTTLNLSRLQGNTQQKLETLYFLRNNAAQSVRKEQIRGGISRLQKAQANLEAINYEISKLSR